MRSCLRGEQPVATGRRRYLLMTAPSQRGVNRYMYDIKNPLAELNCGLSLRFNDQSEQRCKSGLFVRSSILSLSGCTKV